MINSFKLLDSKTQWKMEHGGSDICCTRFSNDGSALAIGCFNGSVFIRNSTRSRLICRVGASSEFSPITSIKWHPKESNILYCAAADGAISCWDILEKQALWKSQERGNTVHSIDVSPDCTNFSTVGSDLKVKIYDCETRKNVNTFQTKRYVSGYVTGHANRIFSGIYVDDKTFASCGWDDTILIWDARSGFLERTIMGPHVCGDAMVSIKRESLITGSWRAKDQLQKWDIGTGKCEKSISIGSGETALEIYSVAMTPNRQIVACGGSGNNRVSFYRTSDLGHMYQTGLLDSPVNAVHFSERYFAYGLANSQINVDNYRIN